MIDSLLPTIRGFTNGFFVIFLTAARFLGKNHKEKIGQKCH
jgi:hypothetical protein